jgi:hypothetical protein
VRGIKEKENGYMEKLFIVTAGEEIVGVMTFRDAVAYGFGLKDGSSIAMEALEEPQGQRKATV